MLLITSLVAFGEEESQGPNRIALLSNLLEIRTFELFISSAF